MSAVYLVSGMGSMMRTCAPIRSYASIYFCDTMSSACVCSEEHG
jgi:hypothetical protein